MSDPIRCKFVCIEATQHASLYGEKRTWSYRFAPVTASDDNPENKRFWDATPTGELKFGCIHEGLFEPGAEYYVDIHKAN